MKIFGKRTLQVLAVASAVTVLGLITPKAAHAVAAALVQVTNTAANPVISQSIDGQASQLVDIGCGGVYPGSSATCSTISGAGENSPPGYAVPANQTLVVTGVDIQMYFTTAPSQCAGATGIALTTNGFTRKVWLVSGANTIHYAYPSGFLLSPGQVLGDNVTAGSACGASVELHGYRTAN